MIINMNIEHIIITYEHDIRYEYRIHTLSGISSNFFITPLTPSGCITVHT